MRAGARGVPAEPGRPSMLDCQHATDADAAAPRRNARSLHALRSCADHGAAGADHEPDRHGGRARGGRSARPHQPDPRCRGRLGGDARVPPLPLGPRPGRRRGDGHRAARDGAAVDLRPRAHRAQRGRGQARRRRRARLGRRHRSSRAGAAPHPRGRRGRLRGAVRLDRGLRRPPHPDGLARAGRLREVAGRLREGLRPHPVAGAGARHHPLAR